MSLTWECVCWGKGGLHSAYSKLHARLPTSSKHTLSLPRPRARVPPCPPQLNELHNGLLMACAADGSVRVWRNYTLRGQQRLATAWQVRAADRRQETIGRGLGYCLWSPEHNRAESSV